MALFEVPGWTVPSAPLSQSFSSGSRKRKRPSRDDSDKLESAESNIDKLIQKLDARSGSKQERRKKRRSGDVRGKKQGVQPAQEVPRSGSVLKQEKTGRNKGVATDDSTLSDKTKRKDRSRGAAGKGKEKVAVHDQSESADVSNKHQPPHKTPGLTSYQEKMKHSLDGARFRWINEALYKSDSEHAHQMMKEDPNVFEEYHKGFRHQVQSWPINPVSHFITTLSTCPPKTVVADLGCGDATLARALTPKGLTVLSFDLVSEGGYVVEADICARVPLPGSEHGGGKEMIEGEGHVVDIVVCALSLMGTNWLGCIREAWRILRLGGELKIAEVASRFTDMDDFISVICSFGFKLKMKDDRNTHFTLIEFRKVARKANISEKEWKKILSKGDLLKPCEYKRR